MKKRIPITFEPTFVIKERETNCPVCRYHQFLIVQRISGLYVAHTFVARLESPDRCQHIWDSRLRDPACLSCYKATGIKAHTQLTDYELVDMIYWHNSRNEENVVPPEPPAQIRITPTRRTVNLDAFRINQFVNDF